MGVFISSILILINVPNVLSELSSERISDLEFLEDNNSKGVDVQLINFNGDFNEEIVLENDYIYMVISPESGASITEMKYKKCITFPVIENRGAGIVGTGDYFIDVISVNGEYKPLDLSMIEYSVEINEDDDIEEVKVRFIFQIDDIIDGCIFEKIFTIRRNESGFSLRRIVINEGSQPLTFNIGSRFEQKGESWREDLRLYMGSSVSWRDFVGPEDHSYDPITWTIADDTDVRWQLISQYGLSVITQTYDLNSPIEYSVHFPYSSNVPCNAQWSSGDFNLDPGDSSSYDTNVLICEGMHPVGSISKNGTAITTYAQTSADPGDTLPFFVNVVSLTNKEIMVQFQQYYEGEQLDIIDSQSIILEPGKGIELHPETTSIKNGVFYVQGIILDENVSDKARVYIDDGPGGNENELEQIREQYMKKLPEYYYEGSWFEIGQQLALNGKFPYGSIDFENFDFYEEHFPYYYDLLQGVSDILGVQKSDILSKEIDIKKMYDIHAFTDENIDCMGIFFNGPDGPIMGYSKERDSYSMQSIAYSRFVPDEGFSFHVYNGGGGCGTFGINEVGLSTGGASINCDTTTWNIGEQMYEQWLADGNHLAPKGFFMMLATCTTVEEAIEFIESDIAPVAMSANAIIVDAMGDAAVLQAADLLHDIRRYSGPSGYLDPDNPVFTATNYPHPNDEGLFNPGTHWDWYANALFRENNLNQIITELEGNVSFDDVFWIMSSRNQPGGISQMLIDNVAHYSTRISVIADTQTGDLYISGGDPATTHYSHYILSEKSQVINEPRFIIETIKNINPTFRHLTMK